MVARLETTIMSDIADYLFTVKQTAELEGVGITTIFNRLKRNEYEVVEDGTRLRKITGRSILSRREVHLRPAKYGLRAGIKGVPAAHAARNITASTTG
jgi:hypothetical protein